MVFFIILGLFVTAYTVGFGDMQVYSIIMIARDVEDYRGFVLNHSIAGIITRTFGEATKWTEPLVQLPHIYSLLIVLLNSTILI